jgi:hypothetical protein
MFEKPWVMVVRGADGQKVKKTLIRNLGEHRGLGGRIVATGRDTDLQDLDPAMVIAL